MSNYFLKEKLFTFTTFLQSSAFEENVGKKQLELKINSLFVDDRHENEKSSIGFNLRSIADLIYSSCLTESKFVKWITKSFVWKGKTLSLNNRQAFVLITSGWLKLMDLETFLDTEHSDDKPFEEIRWPLMHKDFNEKWRVFDIFKDSSDELIFAIGHSDSTVELIFSQFADNGKNTNRGRKTFKTMGNFTCNGENILSPLRGIFFVNENTLLLVHYSGFIDIWHLEVDEKFIDVQLKERHHLGQSISSSCYDKETQHLYLSLITFSNNNDANTFLKICTVSEINNRINILTPEKVSSMFSFPSNIFSSRCVGNCILKMTLYRNILICLHLDNKITLWEFPLTEPHKIIRTDSEGSILDFIVWEGDDQKMSNIIFIDDSGILTIRNFENDSSIKGSLDNPELLFTKDSCIISWVPNHGAFLLTWNKIENEIIQKNNMPENSHHPGWFSRIFIVIFYIVILILRLFNVPKRRVKSFLPEKFLTLPSQKEDDASECEVISTIISSSTPQNSVHTYLRKKNFARALDVATRNQLDTDVIYKAILSDVISNCENYQESELFEKVNDTLSKISKCDTKLWKLCLDPKISDFHPEMTAEGVIRLYQILATHVHSISREIDEEYFIKCQRSLELAQQCPITTTDDHTFTAFEMMNLIRMFNNELPLRIILNFVHTQNFALLAYLIDVFWPTIGRHFYAIISSIDNSLEPSYYLDGLLERAITLGKKEKETKSSPEENDLLKSIYCLHSKAYLEDYMNEFNPGILANWLVERSKEIESTTGNLERSLEFLEIGLQTMERHGISHEQKKLIQGFIVKIKKYQFIFFNPRLLHKTSIIELENHVKRIHEIPQDTNDDHKSIKTNHKFRACLLETSLDDFSENFTDTMSIEFIKRVFLDISQGNHSLSEAAWNLLSHFYLPWIDLFDENPDCRHKKVLQVFHVLVDSFGLDVIQRLCSQLAKNSSSWKSQEFNFLGLDWISPCLQIILEWNLDQPPKDKLIKLNSPAFAYHLEKIINITLKIQNNFKEKYCLEKNPDVIANLEFINIFQDIISNLTTQLQNNCSLSIKDFTLKSLINTTSMKDFYHSLSDINLAEDYLKQLFANFVKISNKKFEQIKSNPNESLVKNSRKNSNNTVVDGEFKNFLNVVSLVKTNSERIDVNSSKCYLSNDKMIQLMQNLVEFMLQFLLQISSNQHIKMIHLKMVIMKSFHPILLETLLHSGRETMMDYLKSHLFDHISTCDKIELSQQIHQACLEYFQDYKLANLPSVTQSLVNKCLSISDSAGTIDRRTQKLVGLLKFQNFITTSCVMSEETREKVRLFHTPMRQIFEMLIDPIEVHFFVKQFIQDLLIYTHINGVLPRTFNNFRDFLFHLASEDYLDLDLSNYDVDLVEISCQMVRDTGITFIKSPLIISANYQAIRRILDESQENDLSLYLPVLFSLTLGKEINCLYEANPEKIDFDLCLMYFILMDHWNGSGFHLSIEMLRERILYIILCNISGEQFKLIIYEQLRLTQLAIFRLRMEGGEPHCETNPRGHSWTGFLLKNSLNNPKYQSEFPCSHEERALFTGLLSDMKMSQDDFLVATVKSIECQCLPSDYLMTSFNYFSDNKDLKSWTKSLGYSLEKCPKITAVEQRRIVSIVISNYRPSSIDYTWVNFCNDLVDKIEEMASKKPPFRLWTEKLKKDASLKQILSKSNDLDISLLETNNAYREEKIKELSLANIDLGLRLASEYQVDSSHVYYSKLESLCSATTQEFSESTDFNATVIGLYDSLEKDSTRLLSNISSLFDDGKLGTCKFFIDCLLDKIQLDDSLILSRSTLANHREILDLAASRNKWQDGPVKYSQLYSKDILEQINDEASLEILSRLIETNGERVTFNVGTLDEAHVNCLWKKLVELRKALKMDPTNEGLNKVLDAQLNLLIKSLVKLPESSLVEWTLRELLLEAEEKNFNVKLMKKITVLSVKLLKSNEIFNMMTSEWMSHWKRLSTQRNDLLANLRGEEIIEDEDFDDVRLAWNNLPPYSDISHVPRHIWLRYISRFINQVLLFRRHILFQETQAIIESIPLTIINPLQKLYPDTDLKNREFILIYVKAWELIFSSKILRCSHLATFQATQIDILEKLNLLISNLITANGNNVISIISSGLINSDMIRRNFLMDLDVRFEASFQEALANFDLNMVFHDVFGVVFDQERLFITSDDFPTFAQDTIARIRLMPDVVSPEGLSLLLMRVVDIYGTKTRESISSLWEEWFKFTMKTVEKITHSWLLEFWSTLNCPHPTYEFCISIAKLLLTSSDIPCSIVEPKRIALSLLLSSDDSQTFDNHWAISSFQVEEEKEGPLPDLDEDVALSGLLHHGLVIAGQDKRLFGHVLEAALRNPAYLGEDVKDYLRQELCPKLVRISRNLEAVRILQIINYSNNSYETVSRNSILAIFKSIKLY